MRPFGQKLDFSWTIVGFIGQNLDKRWTRTLVGQDKDNSWTYIGQILDMDKYWTKCGCPTLACSTQFFYGSSHYNFEYSEIGSTTSLQAGSFMMAKITPFVKAVSNLLAASW